MSIVTLIGAGQMASALTFPLFENGHEVIAQLGLLPFGQDVPYGGSLRCTLYFDVSPAYYA